MKIKRNGIGMLIGGALLALSTAAPALAAPQPPVPPGGYVQSTPTAPTRGADGVTDHIRTGGSDTTYDVMKGLASLYGGSVGCELPNAGSYCSVSANTHITTENYDHDTVDNDYPTGSGAGVSKLKGGLDLDLVAGNDTDPAFRIARSSAKRSDTGIFQSGFAKDGVSIVGFQGSAHNPTSRVLSKDNLKAIFAGTGPQAPTGCVTNWSALTDPLTGSPFAAQPIVAFGLQTASGTYGTFRAYLDNDDPNTCPNLVTGGGSNYFENHTAPIDGGVDARGSTYTTNANRANAIWWASYGVFSIDPGAAGTSKAYVIRKAGTPNGPLNPTNDQAPSETSITEKKGDPGAYDIQRILYAVLLKNDVDPTNAASANGPGGAANQFRTWLCRRTGHSLVPVNYSLLITDVIKKNGFVRLPVAESTQTVAPFVLPFLERCENTLNP